MDQLEVAELLGAENIRQTYARQNWFACTTLPAPARASFLADVGGRRREIDLAAIGGLDVKTRARPR